MRYLYLFLLAAFITSCSEPPVEKKTEIITEKFEAAVKNQFDVNKFKGRYSGNFGNGLLILQLNYIQGKNASGNNILRGKRRNIKGSVEDLGDHFHFVLKEPGDDLYDGIFEFDIDTTSFQVKGKWIPNDSTAATAKNFIFEKLEAKKNSTLLGEYYGNIGERDGNLAIKKNGICIFSFSVVDEAKSTDENEVWKDIEINGTWLENGKEITLEFEKNKYLEFYRMKLENVDEEFSGYLDGGEKVSFYSGF